MEAKRLEDLNAAASAEGADDETKARCDSAILYLWITSRRYHGTHP